MPPSARASSIVIIASLAQVACQANRRDPVEVVGAAQFRDQSVQGVRTSPDSPPEPQPQRLRLGASEAGGAIEPLVVLTPAEAAEQFEIEPQPADADGVVEVRREGVAADRAPRTVLVDAKVGDINGKAIYANQLLAPMEEMLRKQADVQYRDDPAGWLAMARQEIKGALQRELEQELVRAEAVASLDEQQRRFGLVEITRRMRTYEQRRYRGSQRLFERHIKEQFGEDATLDDYLIHGRNRHISQVLIDQEINRRVNISWREVVQEYERRDEFRPPPQAVFRLIRVRGENVGAVQQITRALESGDPFKEIASLAVNGYRPESGGLYQTAIEGDLPTAEVFQLKNLNEAAVQLRPGEWAGPIEDGPYVSWVQLERIEHREIPLYDAQIAIEQQREVEQRNQEFFRFIERLKQRASFTGLDQMTDDLLRIAAARYHPESLELLGPDGR